MKTEQEHNNVQWKKVRFGEFFDMLPTNTLSRDKLNNQQGEYQNIHYGDVLIKYPFCLDCNNAEIPYINDGVKFNMAEVRDGDVIFADTAEDDTVGKCVEVLNVGDRKIVSGLHTYFCRPRHKMALGYLGYYLNSNHFHNQLLPYIAGSKVSSVNRTSIARTFISYPADLSAQRRIAAILASADKVIAATQKLIAKYKQMKQGMMEELFNEQCTMNNVQWKKVRFDEFFDMLPNNTLSRDKLNRQRGEYLNIHYGDVLINYPFCLDCSCNDIPYINNGEKFNNAKAIDGDVIFADTAEDDTVGKCVELLNVGNRKIVSGLHTYFCRPKFRMASGYLGYYLNSNLFHDQLLPYIAGSKVSSVNRTSIARTFIFFPVSLAEQCRIASILSGIDAKIAAEEKVLEKYEKVKKGLMERLLNEQCTMNNVQ